MSVFYRSNANQKWQFQGETGERSGSLKRVADADATQELSDIVVVYPYNENYYINPRTCKVQASLPATQTYLANSYGLDGNIMISSSEYNQFALKSVCGWLKVQLTGNGEAVKSVTLKGNNGEQVAGEIYINSADATCVLAAENGLSSDDSIAGGNLVFDDTILTEVVLNCGEGVTLGSTAKAFYIALPPQTFEKGLTIDIEATNGSKMTKSTSNAIVIERNTIQPMSVFVAEFAEPAQPNNEIWYTSTDGTIVTPYKTDVFGANIISNTYENGKGVIKFDGDVTSIGNNAFDDCRSLTSVTIPSGITHIGEYAFCYCTSLTSVTIPDSVTSIGRNAFYCCSMTSVIIPNGMISISNGTFSHCSSLSSVSIPSGVIDIGHEAFYECYKLVDIAIPNSVTSIGEGAFFGCRFTEMTIPENVTYIGRYAFDCCESLISVYCKPTTPPKGDIYMFRDNALNRKIYVPTTSVDVYKTKQYWSNYKSYIVGYDFEKDEIIETQPNNEIWYTSSHGAIVTPSDASYFGASIISNTYENGKGVIKFDSDISSIGKNAFNNCSSLTSVTIPNSVTSIEGGAFSGCNNMTELTLPQSITSFGGIPFKGCTGRLIVRCNIPSSSYSYENDRYPTFYNADFTEIIIDECVTSLKDNAFRFCRSLLNVYIKATTPPTLGANAFDGNATGRKIYVPYNSIEQYYAANNWSNYLLTPYDFENNKAYEIEQNPITYDWYTNATDGVYYISTPEELVAFSKLTNGDTEALAAVGAESSINFGGKVINLVADINLNNHCSVLAGSWTPIKSFAGTFNGNNHTISNLFIKSTENAGLFASVGRATIKNLTVQGEITCTSAKDVGGIAAEARSTLFENCISKVNISTSTTNMGTCVGGICGWSNDAKFIACQSTGNVHDKIEEWEWYNYVGGIVGHNANGTIFIACCKLSGSVKELNSQSYSAVGGILGIYNSSSYPIIRSCYTSISVGGREPGHITNTAGYRHSSANIADCYYSGSNYKGIGTNRYGGSDYSYDLGTAKSTDIAAEIVIMNNGRDEWNAVNPDCVCNYKYELDENNVLKLTKQTTN